MAEPSRARRLRLGAAWGSLGAALVHLVVSGGHASEWWGYGVFFVTAAAGQAVYGVLLLGQPWRHDADGRFDPRRGEEIAASLYRVGIVVNVALVALYVVSRTSGVPLLGPEAGERERVDAAGVVCVGLELALIVCLLALLGPIAIAARRRPGRRASG